jgi:hypothetical protein
MNGYPILPSNLLDKLNNLETRVARLSFPHNLASFNQVGNNLNAYLGIRFFATSDPANTYFQFFSRKLVFSGNLFAWGADNLSSVATGQVQWRWYQEYPTPATVGSFEIICTNNVPTSGTSPTLIFTQDLTALSIQDGSFGRLEMWVQSTSTFAGAQYVSFNDGIALLYGG